MKDQIVSELKKLLERSHFTQEDHFYEKLISIASMVNSVNSVAAKGIAGGLHSFYAREPIFTYGKTIQELAERKNILIVTAEKVNNARYAISITGGYEDSFSTAHLLGSYSHPIKGISCDNAPAIVADCNWSGVKLSATCKHYPFKIGTSNGIVIDLNEVKLDMESNIQSRVKPKKPVKFQQEKSMEYDLLFDLVFYQGFSVPCCLDYKFKNPDHTFNDYAVVKKEENGIFVSVRGNVYIGETHYGQKEPDNIAEFKNSFISQCKECNLQWFNTFTTK